VPQENVSPFMSRVGVMSKVCDVIMPWLLPDVYIYDCLFVMTALLCFHVIIAAGFELPVVHVNCTVLPLATTVVGPSKATLRG